MSRQANNKVLWGAGIAAAVAVAAATVLISDPRGDGKQAVAAANAGPQAVPVSVATVERHDATTWSDYSGRLEAVERVEIRSRVSGAVESVHFREGGLVKKGDLLFTIDPEPFKAEVERARADVAAAEARLAFAKREHNRGQQLVHTGNIPLRDLDRRDNAYREADAVLRSARAALTSAKLNLGYTEIRAPIAGRVGKAEITVGNLIAAGPASPILTTLVSVDPIYAGFDADERAVSRALKALPGDGEARGDIARIPVRMTDATGRDEPRAGKLQMIGNTVDAKSGTVRLRAVFDNPDGTLMPGQFARLGMGLATRDPVLLVSERAIGTDQDKKYVLIVDAENRAAYREIDLGGVVNGLRIVTRGLEAGDRVVVNGLLRVRPGVLLAPQTVAMDGSPYIAARVRQNAPETAPETAKN